MMLHRAIKRSAGSVLGICCIAVPTRIISSGHTEPLDRKKHVDFVGKVQVLLDGAQKSSL